VFLAPAGAAQGALPGDTQAPPGFQDLVQAAQGEGALVVMGELRRWATCGEIFYTFLERYGIGIRQLQFNATTPEQMDAIRDNTSGGLVAGVYAMGISAYAQHPNAARPFEEFLLSDEGQILLLKGHAHPIRLDDLVQRQVVSDELLGSLLAVPAGVKSVFPTQAELEATRIAGEEQWVAVVGEVR
jgi:hypothetical protein